MQYKIGDMVRIKHTDYDDICGLDVGTEHPVIKVDGMLTFLVGRYPGGDTLELCFDPEQIEPAASTEPDGVTWGEWVSTAMHSDVSVDFQFQRINGAPQWRYPVPKQPVVETVTMFGGEDIAWIFSADYIAATTGVTAKISFSVIDGKPDWSTLRGEDL